MLSPCFSATGGADVIIGAGSARATPAPMAHNPTETIPVTTLREIPMRSSILHRPALKLFSVPTRLAAPACGACPDAPRKRGPLNEKETLRVQEDFLRCIIRTTPPPVAPGPTHAVDRGRCSPSWTGQCPSRDRRWRAVRLDERGYPRAWIPFHRSCHRSPPP